MSAEFWNYLKQNLSAAHWEQLPQLLGCTPHRLNKIKEGKKDFTTQEIEVLADLTEQNPVELAHRFKLGYKSLTIDEMSQFAALHDQIFQIQFNAA